LLEHDDAQLMLDVAATGGERAMLHLDQWLAGTIDHKGDDFLQATFDFVENKIRDAFARRDRQYEEEEEDENACRPLSAATYSIFIRVIRNAENLSAEDVSRFKHMRTDILILHPSLLNLYPGSKEEQGFSEAKATKEQAIQYEDYFQSMYDGQVTVDERFQDLKRMHASDDPADRQFFSGCLHLMFDEFKWLDRYPPQQLAMTSVLFGTLIASKIIKDIPAFIATRYLLDACKTDVTKPTYSFGVYALTALRGSLVDFPALCRQLKEIDNLQITHKSLVTDIDNALAERAELDSQGGVKLAFPALRLPILVEEGYDEFVEPEPKRKDAIMFIINQIAPSNYEQKSRDLLELFDDQYSRWFANYFIEVRVSLEQNRHEIYMNIIDLLNSPVLEKHILWETYRKIRDLINADATMSSSSQRASLKTIALWLGRITLARNKPIRMRELSVKDILIQGYDNKRLIVAIPFVCNLLASCKESVVFHLPNPWLSAMLALLHEIYTFPEVRLNLKFEIEVLFTKLEVALNAVEPSTFLRTRVPPSQPQGDAADRLDQEYRKALTEILSGHRTDGVHMRSFAGDGEPPAEVNEWFIQRTEELLARLPDAMVFTPDFPFFQMVAAKRAVHDATSLAIREMISPVVERSVTIAGISTRDLLAKDYSTEADPTKLRHAAQLMVKNLAGNLAMVTCKDPLRDRMTSSIRTALVAAGYPESGLPDQVVSGIVDDNLEAATAVLKSLTVDKASKDIDVNLAAHFASRREHHDSRSTQPYLDSASVAIALPPSSLPQILRMVPGGLLPTQARVYEDFAEQPIEQPRVYAANGHGGRTREAEHERTGYQQELDSHTRRPSPRPRTRSIQEAVAAFQDFAVIVDQMIANAPARSLSELPGDFPLRNYIVNVIHLINQVALGDQPAAALGIAQKVVQLLYRCESNLARETYVTMLQSLCELSAIVDKEVKDWLIHAEDAVSPFSGICLGQY
jgi:CCR4-NOT transcription complex subunit 1